MRSFVQLALFFDNAEFVTADPTHIFQTRVSGFLE
jgi:hypothetical protein